eukprot:359937-Chlamydomonas_euryale.AAC.29
MPLVLLPPPLPCLCQPRFPPGPLPPSLVCAGRPFHTSALPPCPFTHGCLRRAVTLNELATGTVPFSDCTKDNPEVHTVLELGYGRQELAAAVAAEGLRPLLPRVEMPPGYEDLVCECWAHEPVRRPRMADVAARMRGLVAALPEWQQRAHGQAPGSPAVGAAVGEHMCGAEAAPPRAAACGIDGMDVDVDACRGAGPLAWERWLVPHAEGACGAALPSVSAGGFEAIGPRDTMEDRSVVMVDCGAALGLPASAPPATLLAVFDGHRGAAAAAHCQARLAPLLAAALPRAASPGDALAAAFRALEVEYRAVWAADAAARAAGGAPGGSFPGCTALAALLLGRTLHVANAGDCRCVLDRSASAAPLSRDHTPALGDERARVAAAGGAVSRAHGSWRLDGGVGLQVTRCIGDFDQKAACAGLTAEPEVTATVLEESDVVVVLASDGLWDVVSDAEAAGLVRDTVKDPTLCAKRLVLEALARGSADNVSAVVAFLRPVSTLERVYGEGSQAFRATPTVYGSRRAPAGGGGAGAPAADELRETY